MVQAENQEAAIDQFTEGETEAPNWDSPVWVEHLELESEDVREPTHDEAKNWLHGVAISPATHLVKALEACLRQVEISLEQILDSSCVRDAETGELLRDTLDVVNLRDVELLEGTIAQAKAALDLVRP
jgi:hypothetical protein